MPLGDHFEVRTEEWHGLLDPQEAWEKTHNMAKKDALFWEEFKERNEDDGEDDGEGEDDAPKLTSSAAAAPKPTMATIASPSAAPATTSASAMMMVVVRARMSMINQNLHPQSRRMSPPLYQPLKKLQLHLLQQLLLEKMMMMAMTIKLLLEVPLQWPPQYQAPPRLKRSAQ
jgi:hypothetical protein